MLMLKERYQDCWCSVSWDFTSLVCGSQVADFREQLLSYAGVDPARIVEFSCG